MPIIIIGDMRGTTNEITITASKNINSDGRKNSIIPYLFITFLVVELVSLDKVNMCKKVLAATVPF